VTFSAFGRSLDFARDDIAMLWMHRPVELLQTFRLDAWTRIRYLAHAFFTNHWRAANATNDAAEPPGDLRWRNDDS
jgi:hypothetical protein